MAIQTQHVRLKRRRTKIVATLGPASANEQTLRALVLAGVDVVRLNMSHGRHEEHEASYRLVRETAGGLGLHVGVLADLCGPKIRVGRFRDGGIDLAEGERVVVTTREVEGEPGLVPSQYAALAGDVTEGDRLLLDDGLLELRVLGVEGRDVRCEVVHGGRLKNHKGMNLPGVSVSAPSLTDKDRADAELATELGVDFVALSFVRRAEDVAELRELLASRGSSAGIVAKIEKPEALQEIVPILDASDAIMVARGDLGVELPPQEVPFAQEQLVDLAKARRKPVIVATQMLESMIENPRPTRAEVTDVAQAVASGADAVMLSGESAVGRHPVRAVEMMDSIARQTEGQQWSRGAFGGLTARAEPVADGPANVDDAVADATARLSRALRVRAIVVPASGDGSLSVVSASRPGAPIVSLAEDAARARRGSLSWGVVAVCVEAGELDCAETAARAAVRRLGLAEDGDRVLLVRGLGDAATDGVATVGVVRV